jgi:hypothetical protein
MRCRGRRLQKPAAARFTYPDASAPLPILSVEFLAPLDHQRAERVVVPVAAVTSIFGRKPFLRSRNERAEIELDLGKSRAAIPLDPNVLAYSSAQ